MKKLVTSIIISLITIISAFSQYWLNNGNNIYNTNSGNVGIGTSTPGVTLDIIKSTPYIRLQDVISGDAAHNIIGFGQAGSGSWRTGYIGDGFTGQRQLGIVTDGTYDFGIAAGSTRHPYYNPSIFCKGTTGYVGINTNSPKEWFQIGNIWTFQDGSTSKVIGYNTYYNGGYKRIMPDQSLGLKFSSDGTFHIVVAPSGSAGSTISWTEALYISNNGNVGIKTTQLQGAAFAVNGKILAAEVEVEDYPWFDLVFKEDYSLMSLKNLDEFIKKNQHLPEIPSESDIQNTNMNLGEMNTLLLKKVEELTLYILDLNKRIEELESGQSSNKE